MKKEKLIIFCGIILWLVSCRETPTIPTDSHLTFPQGLYILNEGNMGSNKATIDFYDIAADSITRDIYPTVNPNVVKELGDVGNDIAIYGSKMYIIINASGKVEITDKQCRRITQVNIPNCRSLCFNGDYAYVTSYAGPIDYSNPNYKQRGYVAKLDTATLAITDTCLVGFQPNSITTDGKYLYVTNSGGYMAPNYDSTLSVISLASFKEEKRITIAENLDAVIYDSVNNALFITSLGNYSDIRAMLYRLDLQSGKSQALGFAATKLFLNENKLYYYSSDYNSTTEYGILNTETLQRESLILSGKSDIRTPYCLFIEKASGDIYITDARDYVTPGVLYRYKNDGTLISRHRTGDIPGHIVLRN